MKKTAIAAGLMAIALPFSNAMAEVSETRDLEPFTKIEFDGMMEVTITAGEEQSFTIITEKEKYLDNVQATVRNGTLRVDVEDEKGFFSLFQDVDVEIIITVQSLEAVEMDGMGDLTIKNVDADAFELVLDGMGSADIDGRCKSARLVLDGMGDLNAKNFECERVRITLDGMGDAEVFASEYVNIVLDGFGDVDVYGDPKESKIEEGGMGSVDFH